MLRRNWLAFLQRRTTEVVCNQFGEMVIIIMSAQIFRRVIITDAFVFFYCRAQSIQNIYIARRMRGPPVLLLFSLAAAIDHLDPVVYRVYARGSCARTPRNIAVSSSCVVSSRLCVRVCVCVCTTTVRVCHRHRLRRNAQIERREWCACSV